ncbi:MAG: beta-propeller domain-containing protein [Candidatus Pacearchaeota archaeon]|nr:beta-propeller domain-containing protein [Candidatus Pacearchaeota archaeon]
MSSLSVHVGWLEKWEILYFIVEGEVSGIILNQFSMCEFEENLRVTTILNWDDYIYVLDEDLEVVGSLEILVFMLRNLSWLIFLLLLRGYEERN